MADNSAGIRTAPTLTSAVALRSRMSLQNAYVRFAETDHDVEGLGDKVVALLYGVFRSRVAARASL